MSLGSVIGGGIRALLIAVATGAATFGLLVVFEPFGNPSTPQSVTTGTAEAAALQSRIEAARIALRDTEGELARPEIQSAIPATATRDQYETQIAAAKERRDLARRHAGAIRTSLDAGTSLASLSEIRDSVLIGQLLSQQAALDGQIAVEGARLRPAHPTMRALTAQRAALGMQVRAEAANIATALEAEANLDDARVSLLEGELAKVAPVTALPDRSALATRAAAQRAELDTLVDAYFNILPARAAEPRASADPLSVSNIAAVVVAALAALLLQLRIASRRRRVLATAPPASDIEAWESDDDVEVSVADPELIRKAS